MGISGQKIAGRRAKDWSDQASASAIVTMVVASNHENEKEGPKLKDALLSQHFLVRFDERIERLILSLSRIPLWPGVCGNEPEK